MLCDFCREEEAVMFLEQVNSDGQKRKIHLCMKCALERGLTGNSPENMGKSLGALFREFNEISKKIQKISEKYCPVCGMGLSNVLKKGICGCGECYAVFKNDIHKYLGDKGFGESYAGSMPERLVSVHSVLNDRIALQNKLNQAVIDEDYEKAALYRDYLRALDKDAVFKVSDEEADNE